MPRFDSDTLVESKYQHVLDYYGELNNCEGWELTHLDRVKFEYPEKVFMRNLTNEHTVCYYLVRLNNVKMILEGRPYGNDVFNTETDEKFIESVQNNAKVQELKLKTFGLYEEI